MAKATTAAQKRPSLNPETFKVGSGLIDDVDSTILDVSYVGDEAPDNYKGGENGIPLFAKMTHQIDGVEGQSIEWFALGGKSKENFEVEDGGKGLTPLFEGAQLSADSNWGLFVGSAVNAGFPAGLLEAENFDPTPLEGDGGKGLRVHFNRVPDTRNFTRTKESKYPPTTLAVTKIYEDTIPGAGGRKGATKKAAPAAAKTTVTRGKPVPAQTDGDGMNEQATTMLLEILADKGGSIKRNSLLVEVTKRAMKDPNRESLRKLIYSPEFLGVEGQGWVFDGKQDISLAE